MSITVQNNVWIDRPVPEVFAYMTEPSNLPAFVPGIVEAAKVGDGPKGVGTKVECTFRMLGGSQHILAEWTRYDPNEAFASSNIEGGKADSLTTFHPENGGTRVERVMKVEVDGFFATLAKGLIRRTVVRNAETEFAQLKDLLEA